MILNKNIQIDDVQSKMSSTGNTKHILISGKDKYYFWQLHKGQPSPVYQSYTSMQSAGLIKRGAVVAIGFTEEQESFVNAQGKTIEFTSRCIVGLREAGSGATVSEPPRPESPRREANNASERESSEAFGKRLAIHGMVNGLLAGGHPIINIDMQTIEDLLVLEERIERALNPSPVRKALEKTNPNFFKQELPTIQQDDPTDGELNPMVNDEPPMNVEDIPF